MSGVFNRKRFLTGAAGGVVGTFVVSQSQGSSATTGVAVAVQPPQGFSYAAGKPPKMQPIKTVRGVVELVDDRQIVVKTGQDLEVALLAERPFIWKNGPVQHRHAAKRLKAGDAVTLSGVTDPAGTYTDIQHVWINLESGVL